MSVSASCSVEDFFEFPEPLSLSAGFPRGQMVSWGFLSFVSALQHRGLRCEDSSRHQCVHACILYPHIARQTCVRETSRCVLTGFRVSGCVFRVSGFRFRYMHARKKAVRPDWSCWLMSPPAWSRRSHSFATCSPTSPLTVNPEPEKRNTNP